MRNPFSGIERPTVTAVRLNADASGEQSPQEVKIEFIDNSVLHNEYGGLLMLKGTLGKVTVRAYFRVSGPYYNNGLYSVPNEFAFIESSDANTNIDFIARALLAKAQKLVADRNAELASQKK